MFLFFYTAYLAFALTETLRNFIHAYNNGDGVHGADLYSLVVLILIGIHAPILLYQLVSQCKNLCKDSKVVVREDEGNVSMSVLSQHDEKLVPG
jgi:hypothetical protein